MDRSIVLKGHGVQIVEARYGRPIDDILRELYVDKGMTQGQVAEVLDVRKATVSRWMQVYGIPARYLGSRKVAA